MASPTRPPLLGWEWGRCSHSVTADESLGFSFARDDPYGHDLRVTEIEPTGPVARRNEQLRRENSSNLIIQPEDKVTAVNDEVTAVEMSRQLHTMDRVKMCIVRPDPWALTSNAPPLLDRRSWGPPPGQREHDDPWKDMTDEPLTSDDPWWKNHVPISSARA